MEGSVQEGASAALAYVVVDPGGVQPVSTSVRVALTEDATGRQMVITPVDGSEPAAVPFPRLLDVSRFAAALATAKSPAIRALAGVAGVLVLATAKAIHIGEPVLQTVA